MTLPSRIVFDRSLAVGRRQPLECICLCVGVDINCCIKILYILHKYNDVVKNDVNGGRRRMMRGYPAMPINYIDNKLIECRLLALDID